MYPFYIFDSFTRVIYYDQLALTVIDFLFQFIWAMMKAWERKNPINRDKLSPDSVTHALISKNPESRFEIESISFEPHPEANPASRVAGLKRFQVRQKGTFINDVT